MTIDEFNTAILPMGPKLVFGDALFVYFTSLEDYESLTIQKGLGVEQAVAIIAHLAREFNLSAEDLVKTLIPNGEDV